MLAPFYLTFNFPSQPALKTISRAAGRGSRPQPAAEKNPDVPAPQKPRLAGGADVS